MKGREIKARTRIRCPLCGSLGWESSFERDNPAVSGMFQYSPGFRQLKFSVISDIGFLGRIREFLIEKLEKTYEKLTGINIQKLLGKEQEVRTYQKSLSVMEMPAEKSFSLKMEPQLSRKEISVSTDLNLKTIGRKNIVK